MPKLFDVYHHEIPSFLVPYIELPLFSRLENVGMNCGVEYTSLPFFKDLPKSSRASHSIGTALITYHFSADKRMALAALFHDIATPCFAHTIDFLNGDHEKQESTEEKTKALLESDKELARLLSYDGLSIEDISDYSRFPLCDNPSPKLSADRLEYTLRNMLYFGFLNKQKIEEIYRDLLFCKTANGEEELQFATTSVAMVFGKATIETSRVYISNEDRFAMEDLAKSLKAMADKGILSYEDFEKDEPALIAKMEGNPFSKALWLHYRSLSRIEESKAKKGEHSYRISSKKRCIDPYVKDMGRLSEIEPSFKKMLEDFLQTDFSSYLTGVYCEP